MGLQLRRKVVENARLKDTIKNVLVFAKRSWSFSWYDNLFQLSNITRGGRVVEPCQEDFGELPDKKAILKIIAEGVQNDSEIAFFLLESVERHYHTTGIPIGSLHVVSGNGLWKILEWKEYDTRVIGLFKARHDFKPLSCLIIQTECDHKPPKTSMKWVVETIEELYEFLEMAKRNCGPWQKGGQRLTLFPVGNLEHGTGTAFDPHIRS